MTTGARSSSPNGRKTKVQAVPAAAAAAGANHGRRTTSSPVHTLMTHSTMSAAAT